MLAPATAPVPALPSRAAQLWSADPGASISSVARQLDIYGAMQATMTQLASGVFLTAYALALGADPLAIAVLAAVPLAAKVSQVFTSAHIERAGHWPQTALVCAAIARLLLLAAAALPFLLEGPMAARALVVIIALSSLAASFFDLALLTWMAELVPPGIRGRFLGTRNRISGLAGQVAALAAAAVIQGMFGETGRSPLVFAVLFAVAGGLGLAALPVLARVPPPRRTHSRVEMLPLRNMLVAPLRDRNVRIFMLFAVLWHAAIGISSPFLLVFMLEELGLSLLSVTALVSLNSFVAAGTMGYWGRLGDHFGAKTVAARRHVPDHAADGPLADRHARTHLADRRLSVRGGAGMGCLQQQREQPDAEARASWPRPFGTSRRSARWPEWPKRSDHSPAASSSLRLADGPGRRCSRTTSWWSSRSRCVPSRPSCRATCTNPVGSAVGRMVRTVGRFHTMNVEEAFSPLVHAHLHARGAGGRLHRA